MAGRPRGSAARDEMLRIRMTSSGMSALDRVRGSVTPLRLRAATHQRRRQEEDRTVTLPNLTKKALMNR
jgi:hypothetical protein